MKIESYNINRNSLRGSENKLEIIFNKILNAESYIGHTGVWIKIKETR
jgi:hypothetical protein